MKVRITLCVSAGLAIVACSGASSTLPSDNAAGSSATVGPQTQSSPDQAGSTVSPPDGSSSSASASTDSASSGGSADAASPPPASSASSTPPPPAAAADASSGASSSGGADSSSSASSSAAVNLITNGNFTDGTSSWTVVSGAGTLAVTNGQLCVAVEGGQQVVVGWSQGMAGVALPEGSYTLSYEARATRAGVTIMAAIGSTRAADAVSDLRSVSDDATTALQTFTHPFTTQRADPSAGLTFTFTSADTQSVCFADVSLTSD